MVFVLGVQNGVLPHYRATGNAVQTEEERRLLYVAMTRARKQLFLTYVAAPPPPPPPSQSQPSPSQSSTTSSSQSSVASTASEPSAFTAASAVMTPPPPPKQQHNKRKRLAEEAPPKAAPKADEVDVPSDRGGLSPFLVALPPEDVHKSERSGTPFRFTCFALLSSAAHPFTTSVCGIGFVVQKTHPKVRAGLMTAASPPLPPPLRPAQARVAMAGCVGSIPLPLRRCHSPFKRHRPLRRTTVTSRKWSTRFRNRTVSAVFFLPLAFCPVELSLDSLNANASVLCCTVSNGLKKRKMAGGPGAAPKARSKGAATASSSSSGSGSGSGSGSVSASKPNRSILQYFNAAHTNN